MGGHREEGGEIGRGGVKEGGGGGKVGIKERKGVRKGEGVLGRMHIWLLSLDAPFILLRDLVFRRELHGNSHSEDKRIRNSDSDRKE